MSGLRESLFAVGDLAFKGAGACMLDCKKMAFTTIIRAVATAATMAIESTGRRVTGSQSAGTTAPAPLTRRARKD
jgi:hypothetical protein